MKNVIIKWTYPKAYKNIDNSDVALNEIDLYCISRVFNGHETILYIGKTDRGFIRRLKSHEKSWLANYRGTKKVRFGIIEKPKTSIVNIINECESALIFELNQLQNTGKTKSYTYDQEVIIKSVGFRGPLPIVVDARKH